MKMSKYLKDEEIKIIEFSHNIKFGEINFIYKTS